MRQLKLKFQINLDRAFALLQLAQSRFFVLRHPRIEIIIDTRMKQFASCAISDVPVNNFYQAIHIYLKKTQVVNRKLSCSSNVVYLELKATCENVNKEIIKTISGDVDSARNALKSRGIEFFEGSLNDLSGYDESQNGTFMSIDRLLPRNLQKFKPCHIVTFIGEWVKITR